MEKKIPTTFVGEIAEGLTQVSPEISKARLRIFYKGFNRNQGYITDEFAEKLLSSLPYTPVVGIFNDLVKDFGGHNQDEMLLKYMVWCRKTHTLLGKTIQIRMV